MVPQFANGAITPIIRMHARLMGTTVLTGSWAESFSARVPGMDGAGGTATTAMDGMDTADMDIGAATDIVGGTDTEGGAEEATEVVIVAATAADTTAELSHVRSGALMAVMAEDSTAVAASMAAAVADSTAVVAAGSTVEAEEASMAVVAVTGNSLG